MRRVAGGGDAVAAECRHNLRVAVRIRIPNGPYVQQAGRVTHERCRQLIVGGTGLAGHLAAAQRAGHASGGAVGGGALHGLLHQRAIVGVEHLLVLVRCVVEVLIIGAQHLVHHVQGVLHAIVGDGRMPLRQIPHGQRVDAQHVVHGAGVDLSLDARFMRDFRRALRRKVFVDVHEHRVHRVGGGLVQVDVAPVDVQRVVHLGGDAGEMLMRVAVEHRVEIHAGLRGAQQRERLHRGTRLKHGLIGVVELLREVIRAGVDRDHGAGLLFHGDAAHLNALRHAVRARVSHGLHRILLGLVNGGNDLISAGVKIFLGERLGSHQLTPHHIQQVSVGAGVFVLLRHVGGLREFGGLVILGGDVAVFLHDVQHALESGLGHIGVVGRIPRGGGGDDAGDHRGFGQRQILGVLVEIRLGGGLDAVGIAA